MNQALTAYAAGREKAADGIPTTGWDGGAGGTIVWKTKSMDVPAITLEMRRRDMPFNSPQVTMKQRTVSFDWVGVVMIRRQTGCNPVIIRDGLKFKTECRPIYVNVPETRRERRSFSTNIPEVAMRTTRVSFSVPVPTLRMQRISWNSPEFRQECSYIDSEACRDDERRAAAAGRQGESRINAALGLAQERGPPRRSPRSAVSSRASVRPCSSSVRR
jgi:hypothetical protein